MGISTTPGAQGAGGLDINNQNSQSKIRFEDGEKIIINNANSLFRSINIAGDVNQVGSHFKLIDNANKLDPNESKNVISIESTSPVIKPINNEAGIEFIINENQQLMMGNGMVAIGNLAVPSNPTKNLYVNENSYINGDLYYFDEKLERKTIQSSSLNSYKHTKENTVQTILFDYDKGFEVISTANYELTLTFQNHFSSMNLTRLDEIAVSENQNIKPEGIDVMGLNGDYISVSVNNVLTEGNVSGDLDSMGFFNDLINGGVIDGDIVILQTLNIYGTNYFAEVFKLFGDVNQMDNIPFPWKHVVTENSNVVDYEFVITENVGIGIATPTYPLEVNGTTSINVSIIPSVNITGDLDGNNQTLLVESYDDILIDLNTSGVETESLFELNNLTFFSDKFGLNKLNENYFLTLHPYEEQLNSLMRISSAITSKVNLNDMFNIYLNNFGYLNFDAVQNILAYYFTSAESRFNFSETGLALHILGLPQNTMDVSGNVLIGESLSGDVIGFNDSVMVESKFGLKTAEPITVVDVYGSMVVGRSSNYMSAIYNLNQDLVVEDQLYVEEYDPTDSIHNMQVNGSLIIDGSLYFNKSSLLSNNELSIYDNQANRVVIGYGSSVTTRSLDFHSGLFTNLIPSIGVGGINITAQGFVSLGDTTNPYASLHVQKPNIKLLVDAKGSGNGDSQIKLESSGKGIIGYDDVAPNEFLLTDGEIPEISGADLAIDQSGQVDIGYNVASATTPQPSHNVSLDVLEKVNASSIIKEQDNVLTHMPEGSIVMWSGWTNELPDGWYLCTGIDDEINGQTNLCNFNDYFVVGKTSSDSLDQSKSVSSHSYTFVTSLATYSHEHISSHLHDGFSEVIHNHSSSSTPVHQTTFLTQSSETGRGVEKRGQLSYNYEYEDCGSWGWNWVCYEKTGTANYPPISLYYYNGSGGEHSHSVSIDHNHSASLQNETHSHNLIEKTHTHSNTNHSHTISNQPEYYTLAFIYLKGEN